MMSRIASLVIYALSILALTTHAIAQCECPGEEETFNNVHICVDGSDYYVNVVVCQQLAPPVFFDPCQPTRQLDALTTIKKICPTSTLPPLPVPNKVMQGVLCALSPTGGNALGFTIPTAPAVFAWNVKFPKCTQFNASKCIVACSNSPCCQIRADFQKDGSTGEIIIAFEYTPCPYDNTACKVGCVQGDCTFRLSECPDCP